MAQSKLTIFDLPRELRDEIWIQIVSHDMRLISGQHMPSEIYKTPEASRRHLTVFNLLLVSRAVKREIINTFRKRCIFTFHTSTLLLSLLEYGSSSWGGSKLLPHSHGASYSPTPAPKIFFEMGHVSIFPNGPVNACRRRDDSFLWCSNGSRRRKMFIHAAHPPGWKTLDPGAARLLNFMHKFPLKLRSLEMSAILLLNIRVVRQLRRLRGVDLHFAFISDEIELPDNVLAIEDKKYPVKWLAETADTNIVLPIYRTESDIDPVSVAPLSCLVIAIRHEVASSRVVSRFIRGDENQVDDNPPLWIDFDDESLERTKYVIATYTEASLTQPTSGWYRYSTRNPGIICLEMAEEPRPRGPLKRKMLKRQRQERLRAWDDEPLRAEQLRRENLDLSRVMRINHLGLEDIVIAYR
ncbi:hypothetical protein N5P37_009112 [Trichoderma harzianum]|uniref:Uncharacterized protein n=1 Tax=Trichoderma harzianum CBS 226.95 TaxID=983964 RepID=A0A2T4A692_TRIHA|nr:hypothetical protein M431DRAFT_463757 [Trichoderma harzianum CBS 226.95]KAK0758713.1 hypothetical protein N5P37_009112 [Trichoderma harzianum]PKK52543.1 hypothetical protein CI102_2849 [Trichoderma harzianum]PTB52503.1 hypothetical protein M431DRAFT_463757 [Trichoderma harzianum CBS 226.95]